jgi:hypothetical protein
MARRQIRRESRNDGYSGKYVVFIVYNFLKSVLISRSPQRFVLRIGAVSFSTDFGRREV